MTTYTNVNDAAGRYGYVSNTVTAFDELPDFSSDGYMQNKTSRIYHIGDNVGTFQQIENGVDSNGVDLPCALFYDYTNNLYNYIVWGEQLFYLQNGSFLSITQPTTPQDAGTGGGGGGNADYGNSGSGGGSGSGSGSGSGNAGSGSGNTQNNGTDGNTGGGQTQGQGTGLGPGSTTGSGSGYGSGFGLFPNLMKYLLLGGIIYLIANRKK